MKRITTEEEEKNVSVGDEKTSKFIVYTSPSIEFHLESFNEFNASGIMESGDIIKFHPEHIIAVRTKQIKDEK